MVNTIIRALGAEIEVGTSGNNFSGNQLIRVFNNHGGSNLITIKDASANVTGSFTMHAHDTAYVRKLPAESIFASANLRMVAVSF